MKGALHTLFRCFGNPWPKENISDNNGATCFFASQECEECRPLRELLASCGDFKTFMEAYLNQHSQEAGDTTEGFKAIAEQAQAREQAALKNGMQYSGLFGVGPAVPAAQPLVYGSLASPIVDGSARIFGRHHETEYPPSF
eukprot:g236.t2